LEVDSYTVLSKGDDEKFDSIDLAKLLGTYASYYMSRINDHDFALSISNLVSWRINKSGVRWPRVSATEGSFRRVEVDDEISPRYVRSKLYGGIVACESA